MSLIPLLYRDLWNDSHLFDHNFGLGLRRDDLFNSSLAFESPRLRSSFLHPWRLLGRQTSSGNNNSSLQVNEDKFQVMLDVQQFSPEEITVKINERTVAIEGKHEEKADEHGYISRQFTRKYVLPGDIQLDQVTSTLSSDGILTITAPKKVPLSVTGERSIPITPTGPARPTITLPQSPQPTAKIEEVNIPVTQQ